MTIDDIKKRVQAIADMADDDERAHTEEDELYLDILMHAATGGDVAEMAKEAVKTKDISFSRWCA